MKAHFKALKTVATLLLLLTTAVAIRPASAQQTPAPTPSAPAALKPSGHIKEGYRLEIVEGWLLLDGLKNRIDIQRKFGPGDVAMVSATLDKLVAVLGDLYPDVNIVMRPGLGQIKLGDLKYVERGTTNQQAAIHGVLEALRVASGEAFGWAKDSAREAPYVLTRTSAPIATPPSRVIEAFSVSGYIQQLGTQDRAKIHHAMDQIQEIINISSDELQRGENRAAVRDGATFRFHEGASLIVVTGSPEFVEVARKVVNALPGQVRTRELQDVSVPTSPAEPRRKF